MKTNDIQRARWLATAAFGAIALGVAMPAAAQENDPQPAQTASADDQDDSGSQELVVTGSRIRGIAPVGSNVIAIDQSEIALEPVTSTNDLLRRVPQVVSLGANRAGGSAQNGAANATRGAGINLRGLSTGATLLLYDGRRFPPQGTQGQFTDPSVLPSIALGRIEVVADGSSAIYGSDAIAGVVNFILRKDVNGIEARARYGFTEGDYSEKQVSVIAGTRGSRGYAMVAAEYTQNDPLMGSQLDFYQNDNRSRGGRDLRVTNCNPGTITAGGSTYAIPVGGVRTSNVGTLVAGTRNLCFYGGLDPVILEQERYSVVGAAGFEPVDGVRIFTDGFYSRRTGQVTVNPTISTTVTNANPFFVTPVPGGTSVTVAYSLVPELGGPLYNPFHASSWNLSGGVEARLFGDFKGTVYYAHGESEEVAERLHSGVNAGALAAALADPNPATSLNLFGGPNNPATLAKITDNLFIITGRTRLDVVNGQIDGSLFAMPGGAVRIAVGGEHRVEYTFSDLITGQAAGTRTSVHDSGTRNVDAVFGELFLPLVGADNASTGFEQLSVSVALRYENYSDFGSTTNPKIGVTYKPFNGLTLRGSYGTSFRAPTFTEVSTVAGGAGLYFDTLPGPSGNQIGIGIAGGNPNLRPEIAKTWSFGIEAAPESIPGLRASVTYFRINYTDQIQALRGTAGLLTSPLYSSFVQFNPSPATVAALVTSGLPVNQPINQAQVTFIADGRRQNLGTSLLRGLDFGLSYDWTIGDVKLDAGIQGTYNLDYLFEAVPGSGLVSVLGTFGFTQEFRSQADLGLQTGGFRTRLVWNHLSGYFNNTVNPRQAVSNYDTFDISVSYELTDNFSISGDIRNALNEDPPFVDTTTGYDPQSANPIPRLFSITARVKF